MHAYVAPKCFLTVPLRRWCVHELNLKIYFLWDIRGERVFPGTPDFLCETPFELLSYDRGLSIFADESGYPP